MRLLLDLVQEHRETLVDRLTGRIVERVPRYALIEPRDLRGTVEGFIGDLEELIASGDSASLASRIGEVVERRVAQGVAPGDFMEAVLQIFPIFRDFIREAGPENDPEFARTFVELESVIHGATSTAVNAFLEVVSRQLASKNRELNRLNQRLRAHEQALTREAAEARSALETANEFNQRVIESLTSGVAVVDWASQSVSLYSSRLEQIVGFPPEEVLGRPIVETLSRIRGFDPMALVERVKRSGRLPLTRMRFELPDGRTRICFVRAERMFDASGTPEGVVVVIDDVTERELLVDSFSRYVSRDVLQRLLSRGEAARLDGERRTCTIFFADIRGFTALAEQLPPEELHEVLNTYFRVMIGVVTRHGGFIDKFVGDKIMAIFDRAGASRHAAAAVTTAREILEEIGRLGEARTHENLAPIEVGIGINTGEVLLGNVGSEERMEFTAIGDAVNVADRLQAQARGGEALVGEATVELVRTGGFEDLGTRALRGREKPQRVFRLSV